MILQRPFIQGTGKKTERSVVSLHKAFHLPDLSVFDIYLYLRARCCTWVR